MDITFEDIHIESSSYLAPRSQYWALPEEMRRLLSNGCGPNSIKIDLVPDSLLGADFSIACEIHDVMYHFGLGEQDKKIADRTFLFNLLTVVDQHCIEVGILDRLERVALREAAFTYYKAVADWGRKAFWNGKDVNK
jgi:hypothetical protein